jgi:hypothetical protein
VTRAELDAWLEERMRRTLFVATHDMFEGVATHQMFGGVLSNESGRHYTLTREGDEWLLNGKAESPPNEVSDAQLERASFDSDSLTIPLNGNMWHARDTAHTSGAMSRVVLHKAPGEDELMEIDLPPHVGLGHTFEHDGTEWTIVGKLDASKTELPVRGSAWLAAPPPIG